MSEDEEVDNHELAQKIMKDALAKITPEQALEMIKKIGPVVTSFDMCCPTAETELAVFEIITGQEHPVDPSEMY
jgi:hypothetical protein